MENKIEIVAPDCKGEIQLTAKQAETVLRACGLYVGAIESYHPDAHADVMQIFKDCSITDPSFVGMTDLFVKTMCAHGYCANVK